MDAVAVLPWRALAAAVFLVAVFLVAILAVVGGFGTAAFLTAAFLTAALFAAAFGVAVCLVPDTVFRDVGRARAALTLGRADRVPALARTGARNWPV